MPAEDERRELMPMIIASIVGAIGVFFLWSDLRNELRGSGDGMITSAIVWRAGATMTPSEPAPHLLAPQTVPASKSSTVGRATR